MANEESKNMFAKAAGKRIQSQEEIEAAARKAAQPAVSEAPKTVPVLDPDKKYRKRGENGTTVTMSISMEDKAKLKYFAAKRGMNASDLLHFWIVREEQEVGLE